MKTNCAVILFVFIYSVANAQSPNWLWAKSATGTGNQEGTSASADAAGNVFVAGGFPNSSITFGSITLANNGFGNNFAIAKYDANGNVLWVKGAGGSYSGGVNSVSTDAGGNVFVTGAFNNNITFGYTTLISANSNVFVAKYDANGNALWAKSASGSSSDIGISVSADKWGNVFVTGAFGSPTLTFGSITITNSGIDNIFVAKYDANGNILWAKSTGGISQDVGYSVSADALGNVFVTGYFESPGITFGSTTLTNAGGSCSPFPCPDIFIAKYDANGNILWAKSAGGTQKDQGNSVSADAGGNVFMTGGFTSPTLTFGTTTLTNVGDSDVFLAKYDPNGNILWAKSAGGANRDMGYSVSADAGGNVFMTGGFKSPSITFGSTTITSPPAYCIYGCDPMFIVKYDANGNVLCASAISSGGDDQSSVSVDPFGNAYVGGDIVPANPLIVGTDTLIATGNENIFVAKYTCGCSMNISVYGNTTICSGQSATLTTANGADTYFWNTGATTASIIVNPTITTNYSVIVSYGSCSSNASATVTVNSAPIPIIVGNTSLCTGDIATLTASGGSSYSWNTGASAAVITVNPSASTAYTLVATNANGCSASTAVNVTVSPPPIAVVSNATICSGQAATLTASGGGNYSWSNGNTSPTINVSPTTNTTYSVIVFVGSCMDTASAIVIVDSLPSASVSGSATICPGQNATLTASGGVNYFWSSGATTSVITISPSSTTTYFVIVSNASCSSNASATVTVNSVPVPIITGNTTLCIGDATTLTASGGSSYSWNTGTTTAFITVNPSASTSYTLVAINANGCSASVTISVTVSPPPVVSISGNTTICAGKNTILTAEGGGNYFWNTNATTASINISSAGNYSVVVSIGTCSATATASVSVNPTPVANISSNITITQGQSTMLTSSGGENYLWSNGISDSINFVSPTTTTMYCVRVYNVYNCSDSTCVIVTVEPIACSENLFIPNAFSPNNDEENDTLKIYYGNIDCIKKIALAIYDRWGEQVYITSDPKFSWDGVYQSKILNTQVLTYYLSVEFTDKKLLEKKGNISLVR